MAHYGVVVFVGGLSFGNWWPQNSSARQSLKAGAGACWLWDLLKKTSLINFFQIFERHFFV